MSVVDSFFVVDSIESIRQVIEGGKRCYQSGGKCLVSSAAGMAGRFACSDPTVDIIIFAHIFCHFFST